MNKIESAYKEMMNDVQMSGEMIAYCLKDKALELQRELTTVTAQRDMLAGEIEQLKSQLTKPHGCVTISRNGYVEELEQQRDRMAAVLQRIRDGYGGQVASPNCCEDCDYLLPIDEALQSLTTKP
jgi:hypothetical protein